MNARRFWSFGLRWGLIIGAVGVPQAGGAADAVLLPKVEPLRYEEPVYLTGSVYGLNSNQLLFRFQRLVSRSGSVLNVQRDFTYPDGKLAVRERVVYDGDVLARVELEEFQIGAAGKVTVRPGSNHSRKSALEFEYQKEPGGARRTRTELLAADTVLDDTLVPFLLSHWDALDRGEKVRCHCIVLQRTQTLSFSFVKVAESTLLGTRVIKVKMEPSSALVSAFLEPLLFTMEKAPPHHVLQYSGRTTPRLHVGSRWKELDAVTVFDWGSAR